MSREGEAVLSVEGWMSAGIQDCHIRAAGVAGGVVRALVGRCEEANNDR